MGNIKTNPAARWRGGLVYYSFRRGDFTASEITDIEDSLKALQGLTHWRFERLGRRRADHVQFRRNPERSSGRSSYVGNPPCVWRGEQQYIVLTARAPRRGTVIHEMFHAIGVQHEQSRPDRDDHVVVHMDRAKFFRAAFNLNKLKGATPVGDYDYDSIMHYGRLAKARNLRYDIGNAIDRAAYFTVRREPNQKQIHAVLYSSNSRHFERWQLDASGRLETRIDNGMLDRRWTNIAHAEFAGRRFELRYDRQGGAHEVHEIDDGGLPADLITSGQRQGGSGGFASPTFMTVRDQVLLFEADRVTNVGYMTPLRRNGRPLTAPVTFSLPHAVNRLHAVRMFGQDVLIALAFVRNRPQVSLFRIARRARESRVRINLLNTVTWRNWPKMTGFPMFQYEGTDIAYVFGYRRGNGALHRYDLDLAGNLGNHTIQKDLPRQLELVSLYRSRTSWNFLTINAKGGVTQRGRGWKVGNITGNVGSEHLRTEPVIEVIDDPFRPLGVGPEETWGLTPTDIITANLLCDRNLHVNAVHPDGNMSDERLEIEFAARGFSTVIPYRAGRSRLLLFGNPGTRVSARAIMPDGSLSPANLAVVTTGLPHWRSLAMSGSTNRPMLYALHSRTGEVVRYRMSQTRVATASASVVMTNYGRFNEIASFTHGGQAYMAFFRSDEPSMTIHQLNQRGDFADLGSRIVLPKKFWNPVIYSAGGSTHLVLFRSRARPRFFTFDPDEQKFRRNRAIPDPGPGWSHCLAFPDLDSLMIYDSRKGRMQTWRLGTDGLPETRLRPNTIDQQPGWVTFAGYETATGHRLLRVRPRIPG
ncbi:MAG: M12 family metallopeptidase [Alphaproteobacteria bacterium]|nr:M12 family metallopeptidase [Alphaproteobacteria bacterium]